MQAEGGQMDTAISNELASCWKRVLDNIAATGRVASDEFPFLLPDSSIAGLGGEKAYAAFTRKRLFLEYAVQAVRRSGHPLEAFTRELDRMVRSLMPLTQRWQAEQQQGTAPTLPVLDASAPVSEQLAMVRLNGVCLFPGEELSQAAHASPARRILLTPGPVAVTDDVVRAVSRGVCSDSGPSADALLSECLDALLPVVGTTDARLFIVTGGTALAREIAVANLAGVGEGVLVLEHGHAGEEFADVALSLGRAPDVLRAEQGAVVDPGRLRERLVETHPVALVISHVDSSTGVVAPIDAYMHVAHEASPQTLVAVDAISAAGGIAQHMDEWDADCVVTVSDQALASLSGLVIAGVSQRALRRVTARPAGGAYYADLVRWLPGKERMTPSGPLVAALRVALYRLHAEGLPARYARHEALASLFRQQVADHELGIVALPGCEAPTVTVVRLPEGIDAHAVVARLAGLGVDVAMGYGALQGSTLRVAHVGETTDSDLGQFWHALEQVLPAGGDNT
jgi:alanine-glyoxylate transaminase/serine-glyoxylate transaminase/serine-pyruvate transaminase